MFILFGWCSDTGIWNTSIDIVQSERRIYRFMSFIPFCRFSLRCLQITTRLDQILLVTFCLLISGWLHLISRSIYQVWWKLRLNSVQSNTGMIGVPVTQPPGHTCPTPTVLEEELYYKLWCCRFFYVICQILLRLHLSDQQDSHIVTTNETSTWVSENAISSIFCSWSRT